MLSIKTELINIGYELIIYVVNDGSTDTTKDLADNFKEVLVITHKKNKGLGAAVRTGLSVFKATESAVSSGIFGINASGF